MIYFRKHKLRAIIIALAFVSSIFNSKASIEEDSLNAIINNAEYTSINQAKALLELGNLQEIENLEESKLHYKAALNKITVKEAPDLFAQICLNIGNVCNIKGNYKEGFEYLFRALNIWDSINNIKAKVSCLHGIGEGYRAQSDHKKALKFLYEGLAISKANELNLLTRNIYNRISAVLFEMKEFDKSLVYADSALMYNDPKDLKFLSNNYNIIGAIYDNFKQYDSAFHYLQLSLNAGIKTNDLLYLPGTYNNIASLHTRLKNYDSAIFYSKISNELARKHDVLTYQETALLNIYRAYKELKKFDSALHYHEYYTGVRWQIFNRKRSQQILEVETKYRIRQKEQQNDQLVFKNNLQNQKLAKQRILIALIIALVLLGTIVPISINKRRLILKKSNIVLQKQKEEIERQSQELLELNKTKDKILSIIAHDLKNPFHSIQGFAEIVMDEAQKIDHQDMYQYSDLINQSINNINYLLDNLLKWSQLQRGILKINKEEVNLLIVSKEIEKLFESNLQNKEILIENNIKATHLAFCDKLSISTVLRNLISNAIKFSPSKSKIVLSSKLMNNHVEISVTDQGIGMSKEIISKVFTLDKEIKRGTKNEKGSGLGLVLCKEFVEMNGGKIEINSQPKKGTTIKINIPVS